VLDGPAMDKAECVDLLQERGTTLGCGPDIGKPTPAARDTLPIRVSPEQLLQDLNILRKLAEACADRVGLGWVDSRQAKGLGWIQ
jgi:hypothetical protein